ncbi:Cys-rich peptide radical SAM maturase CcpM [Clostridium estertheticum]|uniref:Cys-rich peptide radical SAM maturase CcpM n=1 Tax=Clostridium estertheticum TaxID=238834 RepID=UPI00209AD8FD|nr:Cys-rich peptide radical SAM maturase CcpM [Clostridium estertheticum]
MNNKSFIKLFKTSDKYYMYDVNKNTILNISNTQYDILKKYLECNTDNYIESEEISKLCKEGFLSSNRVKEIIHPANELLSFYLENNVKMLILQVTQQCNFRCEYCGFSGGYLNRGHSNKKMDISTALKGIDFLINHSKNNDEIYISFYGGEPLLEFNLIKQCIEYCEKEADCKKIAFNMTTNGSLLTDEIIEFFYKHNVLLTISLDGPKEIHDIHRKFASNNHGSFDKVISNLINIEKNFPDYINKVTFNAVIDPQNDFDCIDRFFLNDDTVKNIIMRSSIISANYNKTLIKVDENYSLKHDYELFRFFYYLIRKKNVENCSKIAAQVYDQISLFSKKLIPEKLIPEKTHPSGQCIPGCQRLFMSVDGFLYPCEKASESSELMKIGHIDTGFDINKIGKILNICKLKEDDCKNCWAIRFCGICACSVDNTKNEFSKELKEEYCKRLKSSIEEELKDYCFLKEFGHIFSEENRKTSLCEN